MKIFFPYKLIFIIAVAALNMSMTRINAYDLLTDGDIYRESNEDYALRALPNEEPPWESFNKWMCFSSESTTPYCADIDDGRAQLPILQVAQNEKLYNLDIDPQPDLNCETVLNQWIELLQNQKGFCVFAAYLQNIDENHELWVIDTIKSGIGTWDYSSLDQELNSSFAKE